ncbi:curlin, partial [Pseudoalteromonas citrea]
SQVERASGTSNELKLSQTSGSQGGNELASVQLGTSNLTDVTTIGDNNITEADQNGTGNVAIITTTGNNNNQVYSQDGESNGALTEVTGDDNAIDIQQSGSGILGINNE